MPKKFLSYFINIAAVVLIAFGVRYYLSAHHLPDSSSSPATQTTQALFAASFHDVDGKPQALSQWKGKLIVVNFWATWCPPCLEEMPELSRLQEKYRGHDVVVLGISTDELDKIREFAKEHPVSYPLLAGNVEAMDLGISLGNDKGVLPYTAIIKADGTIAKTYFGQVDQALLEQTLLPLIKAKTKL
jgi:thiol-disulfide isomerase/thioredoxin